MYKTTNLKEYLPDWFRQIVEMLEICKSETFYFDILAEFINRVSENFYFQTLDESAISLWERVLYIVPNPKTESIAFRRERVLNRISTKPPYTLGFLYEKLDQLIGAGKYEIFVDYPNYTLYIRSSAENQNYASEVSHLIGRVKPAHIVYRNQPLTAEGLELSTSVEKSALEWKYKLGLWKLGEFAFKASAKSEVIVVPSGFNITDELLKETASGMLGAFASAKINGNIVVSALTKSYTENIAEIQYTVDPAQTQLASKLELLDADGNVLTATPVYVPIAEPTTFTHKITVDTAKEV